MNKKGYVIRAEDYSKLLPVEYREEYLAFVNVCDIENAETMIADFLPDSNLYPELMFMVGHTLYAVIMEKD